MAHLTEEQLKELNERSKDDFAIIVGSEVRLLIMEVTDLRRALRATLPLAQKWAEGEHRSAPVWDEVDAAKEVLGDG